MADGDPRPLAARPLPELGVEPALNAPEQGVAEELDVVGGELGKARLEYRRWMMVRFLVVHWRRLLVATVVPWLLVVVRRLLDGMVRVIVETLVVVFIFMVVLDVWGAGLMMGWRGWGVQ